MSAPDQELRELRALLQQALTKIDGLLGVPAGSGGADKEDVDLDVERHIVVERDQLL